MAHMEATGSNRDRELQRDFDRVPQLQRVEPYERRSINSTEEASRVRTALVRLGRLPTAALLTRPDDTVPEPPPGQGNVDAPSLG